MFVEFYQRVNGGGCLRTRQETGKQPEDMGQEIISNGLGRIAV